MESDAYEPTMQIAQVGSKIKPTKAPPPPYGRGLISNLCHLIIYEPSQWAAAVPMGSKRVFSIYLHFAN